MPDQVSWSYEGSTGPEHWADLHPSYTPCNGRCQSPVDLGQSEPGTLPPLKFDYQEAPAHIWDTGFSVQIDLSGGTLHVGDAAYALVQFHFHLPAEHTEEKTRRPAELHLVHQGPEEEIAVVGVFIEAGAGHPLVDAMRPHLPGAPKEQEMPALEPALLLPDRRDYYAYEGSLTTPPCTEGVRWIVLQEPIAFSSEQLDLLRRYHDGNARPIQPLNGRIVRRSGA